MTEIILKEKPVATINGTRYTMRRLGIPDVFKFAKIFGPHIHTLADMLAKSDDETKAVGANMIATIITLVPELQEPLVGYVASVIGVETSALEDPEQFPLSSIDELFNAISTHPDLKSFLERLSPLVLGGKKAPSTPTLSPNN